MCVCVCLCVCVFCLMEFQHSALFNEKPFLLEEH